MTADVKFKQKYRERLCEVIDQLGLQEFEDLPLELSDEADFEEFCQRFHSRMMTETCGIIHTTVLEKLMAKKLALGQTRTFDPINLVSGGNGACDGAARGPLKAGLPLRAKLKSGRTRKTPFLR